MLNNPPRWDPARPTVASAVTLFRAALAAAASVGGGASAAHRPDDSAPHGAPALPHVGPGPCPWARTRGHVPGAHDACQPSARPRSRMGSGRRVTRRRAGRMGSALLAGRANHAGGARRCSRSHRYVGPRRGCLRSGRSRDRWHDCPRSAGPSRRLRNLGRPYPTLADPPPSLLTMTSCGGGIIPI